MLSNGGGVDMDLNLPELKGTEDEIKQAEKIRQDFIDNLEEKFGHFSDLMSKYSDGENVKRLDDFFYWILENEARAKFFIDNQILFKNS